MTSTTDRMINRCVRRWIVASASDRTLGRTASRSKVVRQIGTGREQSHYRKWCRTTSGITSHQVARQVARPIVP